MTVIAALLVAAAVWTAAETAAGRPPRWTPRARPARPRASRHQWLQQAGAGVTPTQFWAVCITAGAVTFLLLFGLDRSVVIALLPAIGVGAAPYAYWAGQRRTRAAAVSAAWPDAIRRVRSGLAAGIATLHEALIELAANGPEGLRPAMGRYTRLAGQIGTVDALETVRHELADPVSDSVLLTFQVAAVEGTSTTLTVLDGLLTQISGDLALAERIRTAQTQARIASWGSLIVPYLMLILFSATQPAYRAFYSSTGGAIVVIFGAVLSTLGFWIVRRLARPIPTTQRVFSREGTRP